MDFGQAKAEASVPGKVMTILSMKQTKGIRAEPKPPRRSFGPANGFESGCHNVFGGGRVLN